jgi:putative oxidoreductase
MSDKLSQYESHARSVMRIILAFVFCLHGFRHLFGWFPAGSGRARRVLLAIDALPSGFGALEIAGGLLLLVGLFSRPVAFLLSAQALLAYLYSAAPRGPWPIRNGGNETLLYFLAFLYIAVTGPGVWSLDRLFKFGSREEETRRAASKS